MRTRPWCVAVALVVASAPSTAQTVLSEADALSRMSPESPRVRVIRSSIDMARAESLAIGQWPNPRLGVGRESVAGIAETMTTVSQPLPITGRRSIERDAADQLVVAATSRSDDALRRARADLRQAYAELSALQVQEREMTLARTHLRELSGILARREEAGDAAGFDRLRAEHELLDLETALATVAADRVQAQGRLASFFADGADAATIIVADIPPNRAAIPDTASLIARARASRGELLALDRELESAHLSTRAAERRWIPEPELMAGTKTSSALGGDIGSVVSIQAVLPLFNRGQSDRALAEARAKQVQARIDAYGSALASEIVTLRSVTISRRSVADRYRSALSGGEDVERIARVSYEAGERGILELLDAYRMGLTSRLRAAALASAARKSEIELEFVSGWELP